MWYGAKGNFHEKRNPSGRITLVLHDYITVYGYRGFKKCRFDVRV